MNLTVLGPKAPKKHQDFPRGPRLATFLTVVSDQSSELRELQYLPSGRGNSLQSAFSWHGVRWLLAVGIVIGTSTGSLAQATRKPTRAKPPTFSAESFEGIFFKDAAGQLKGSFLDAAPQDRVPSHFGSTTGTGSAASEGNGSVWPGVISATSLEDLVKGSKLRLEKDVLSPATFRSSFEEVRREFLLQTWLFAIIENYPAEVRWKSSAAQARNAMASMAAGLEDAGTLEQYRQVKQRLLDLDDLLRGNPLSAGPASDTNWSELMDRPALMQLLEWAHQDHVTKLAANEAIFTSNQSELRRFSELIAGLGTAALQAEMPDATDDDYLDFAQEMIAGARQIGLAVESGSYADARSAAAKVGQSCANCHEYFR